MSLRIPNLIGGYRLEDTPNDWSGQARHGSVTGMTYDNGIMGRCGSFDGSDDFITLPASCDIINLTQTTLAAWFRFSSKPTAGTSRVIVSYCTPTNGLARFDIRIYGQSDVDTRLRMTFRPTDGGGATTPTCTTSLAVDTWYFGMGVYDSVNDSHKVYLNGTAEVTNTTAVGAWPATSSAGILIGGLYNGASPIADWNGMIDEVTIWSSAISSENGRRLMQGLLPL